MNDQRMKCYLQVRNEGKENQVYIEDNSIIFDYFDFHHEIAFDNVDYIEVSLVSRIYNHSDLLVAKGFHPMTLLQGDTRFASMKYYIDLDVHTKNESIYIESEELLGSKLFLFSLQGKIKDSVGVIDLMKEYENNSTGHDAMNKYLNKNYPILARRYNLENPRIKNPLLYDMLKRK